MTLKDARALAPGDAVEYLSFPPLAGTVRATDATHVTVQWDDGRTMRHDRAIVRTHMKPAAKRFGPQ